MRTESVECPAYRQAFDNPDRIALRSDERTISYGQLEERIRFCAAKLADASLAANCRVAVMAQNSLSYATLIHAVNRIGATLVPISTRYSSEMIADCIRRSGCRLLLTDKQRPDVAVSPDCDHLVFDTICPDGNRSVAQPTATGTSIGIEQESTIMFTSGTSGAPKGVVLTYGNHYYNGIASNQNIQLQPDDCWLAVLPFYHVGGHAILFRTALAGGSAYVMSRFDTHRVSALMEEGMITHLSLVPTMLESLLDVRGEKEVPGRLKVVLLGGAPATRRLIDRASQFPIVRTYGMTETASQVCTTPQNASFQKLHTSGKPLKHSEVAIFDDGGSPVGENEAGEIAVRGRIMFKGYLGEKIGSALDSDGWFRTGDIGHIDEDGYLNVSGRKDDMFISGGENIRPSEIEKRAMEFSGVSECAVIAIDDAEWGKRPVLFVKWSDEAIGDTDSLRAYLKRHLSEFAVPDAIVEIDELPRKSIDKIDSEKLRDIYLTKSDDHG